jgi:hypothetical protein
LLAALKEQPKLDLNKRGDREGEERAW